MKSEPERRIDRPFTYAVSVISLLVGIALAALVGLPLLSLSHRLSVDASGNITWSFGQLIYPLAALLTMAILYWSIFSLPLRIARRRGVILDPAVWPVTGAILVGIVVVVGFVGAILTGII